MTANELFTIIAQISGVLGIVCSMLAMGLGTAQRNVAAAILITLTNFAGTNAVPFVLVAAILLPLILISTARWLGRRSQVGLPTEAPAAPPAS